MAVYHEFTLSDELLSDSHKFKIRRDYIHVKDALKTIRTEDWENVKEFLKPRGQQRVNLIHLASYTGRLEVLKRAEALGVDLYVVDKSKRCALHYAAGQGHVDVVRWLVENSATLHQLRLQDISGKMPLHLAVEAKHVKVVKILVDARVDVNIYDKYDMTPLHLAWIGVDRNDPEEMSRYENIVDIILASPSFKKFIDMPIKASGMMLLNCAVRLRSSEALRQLLERSVIIPVSSHEIKEITTPLHIAAYHGFHEMLHMLLLHRQLTSWMINMRNVLGQTPLHVAVSQSQLKCARTLVNTKGNLASVGKNGLTVIDALFRYNEHPVDFLTEILDVGVSTKKDINMINLNFQVLAPEGKLQMAVVSSLIRAVPSIEDSNVLQHPLVEAFLRLKWVRLRYSFVILIAFQAVFVTSLSLYGIAILEEKCDFPTPRKMLLVCACILFCHNMLQFIILSKYYVKQLETWLSMICAILCIVVSLAEDACPNLVTTASLEYTDQPFQRRRDPPDWVLQCTSIAILLACIQVMLLLGRFQTWGYYALMFSTVLKNVLKVFLAVIWIIVGFSFSFAVLFHPNDQFDNPGKAFTKTVVMMMGEYEYSSLFSQTAEDNSTVNNSTSDQSQMIPLPFTSRIIFLVFVMLTSIVLMNLMVGMAVTNIQELLNQGLIRCLLKQAEFVTHLERVTSHWIFQNRLVPRFLTQILQSMNMIPIQMDLGSSARYRKAPRGISKKLVKKLSDLAARNRNIHEKFQTTCSRDDSKASVTKTIFCLQEGLKKLQLEMMRIQGTPDLTCRIVRRRNSTIF